MSDSLWPHEPQHARPPCPSPTPRVYAHSCPLSRWCCPDNSSSDEMLQTPILQFAWPHCVLGLWICVKRWLEHKHWMPTACPNGMATATSRYCQKAPWDTSFWELEPLGPRPWQGLAGHTRKCRRSLWPDLHFEEITICWIHAERPTGRPW